MSTETQRNDPLVFKLGEKPRLNLDQIQQVVQGEKGRVADIREMSTEKEVVLEAMRSEIVGQDEACKAVADVMDVGLNRTIYTKGPLGVLFLAGPTGVGKTETVKVLAKKLLGNENAFTRVNCEQFQDGHTARSLFGAPPSYVGYSQVPLLQGKNVFKHFEEGKAAGKLSRIIKGKSNFGIILFDEIEKAHPKVRQSLLSLLDDGKITFANGKTTSYENVLVVFTSNVGEAEAVKIKNKNPIGFGSPSTNSCEAERDESFRKAMEEEFSPEFRGRIGAPVRYKHITKEHCSEIVRQQIDSLNKYIEKYFVSWNMHIGISDTAIAFIVEKGFSEDEGARPLSKAIAKYISNPVNRTIKEYAGEDFLERHNPSILFFDVDDQGEKLTTKFYTPNLVPETIYKDEDDIDAVSITTLDLVGGILGDAERMKKMYESFRKVGFSEEEMDILMHLDHEYLKTMIFEVEGFLDDGIDLYEDIAYLFEGFTPRSIKKLIVNKARHILSKDEYSKHIFILTLIVQSIQTIEILLSSPELSTDQENAIIRFAVHAAIKVW